MANQTKKDTANTLYFEEQLTGKLPYTLTNDFFFKAFLQRNEDALRGVIMCYAIYEIRGNHGHRHYKSY